jgi:enoyl-CoA hydratase/carnithine racemase
MSTSVPVSYAVAEGVATIRLERPERKNALTLAMYAAMTGHLEAAGADAAVRCVLFAGQPGTFCAGNDVEDFVAFAASGRLGEPILAFLRALVACRKPLVAAVDGPAVGIGTTLLMHCDHVVASDRSVFATPFVDLGLVPEAASSLIGPRLLGHARAFELLVMGRRWPAAKAEAAGLINTVVGPDALEETARAAALEIARKAPEALGISRALLRGSPDDILKRIDEEADHFAARLRSAEAQQAFMAFLSRRKG